MTWLLLLALPLQGYAAVTMMHCGPSHHRMIESVGAALHEHHAASAAHPHATGVAQADALDDASSAGHLMKLSKFKCSACASCCVGAALPTAALEFDPVAPAPAPTFSVPASHVAFLTDGPDRPPRLSLV